MKTTRILVLFAIVATGLGLGLKSSEKTAQSLLKKARAAKPTQENTIDVYSFSYTTELNMLNSAAAALSNQMTLAGDLEIANLGPQQQLVTVRGTTGSLPVNSRFRVTRDEQGVIQSITCLGGYEKTIQSEMSQFLLLVNTPKNAASGPWLQSFGGQSWATELTFDSEHVRKLYVPTHDGSPTRIQPASEVVITPKSWVGQYHSRSTIKELSSDADVHRRFEVQWRIQKPVSLEELAMLNRQDPEPPPAAANVPEQQAIAAAAPVAQVWKAVQTLSRAWPKEPTQQNFDDKAKLSLSLRDSLKKYPDQIQQLKLRMQNLDPRSVELAIALSAIQNSDHPDAQGILCDLLEPKSQDTAWVDRIAPMLGFTEKADERSEQALRRIMDEGPRTEPAHTATLALGNLVSHIQEAQRQRNILEDLGERLLHESDPFEKKILILALSNTNQKAAIPLIQSYLTATQTELRQAAEKAVERLRQAV